MLHGQRALLLFDNARDAAQVKALVPPAGCCLLLTSRKHIALPGMASQVLGVLPPDEAEALLLKLAPQLGDGGKGTDSPLPSGEGAGVRVSAAHIAALCGHLPLALALAAGAFQRADAPTPEAYAAQLADRRQRLKALDESAELTGENALTATLQASDAMLTAEQRDRWRALSVFPADFDRAAAAAVWALDADAARPLLNALTAYSLLDYSRLPSPSGRGAGGEGEKPEGRYRLHDLARDFAAEHLPEAERAGAQARHAGHYTNVLSAADDLYLTGNENIARGLALFDAERANIEAGQQWAAGPDLRGFENPAGLEDVAARLCNDYPNAGVYVLSLRLHPRERIRWLEDGLRAARQLKNREYEGAHLGSLGLAYADLGETRKAIEYHEQYLAIAREIGDRRGEGNALGNLGIAYKNLGETRKAIEYHEQALVVMRDIGDKRAEGSILGNLGIAHADLGEPRKAIEYHEQNVVIAREIGDRRGEGNALGNLGNAHADLGETRKAIEFYEQHRDIAREIGDRRGEGNALGNLGNAYAALGETRKAIEFYEQRLVIAREIGDRRGEGNALWNMSLSLDSLGQRAQAIAHAEAALKIREAIEDPRAEEVRQRLAQWRGESHGSAERA